ncbi:MAG: hypothetical protein RBJ76_01080 [Stenomitos frigidus ULC029]
MLLRFWVDSGYQRYQVYATPLALKDGECQWVFVADSLEPTANLYAERNLLAVMKLALSLIVEGLSELTKLHEISLQKHGLRRSQSLVSSLLRYLKHLDEGVRYLSERH